MDIKMLTTYFGKTDNRQQERQALLELTNRLCIQYIIMEKF